MSWYSEENVKTLHISQDILRSVLYGKWCNVFGNDRELTFKPDALFRSKDVYKSENSKFDCNLVAFHTSALSHSSRSRSGETQN